MLKKLLFSACCALALPASAGAHGMDGGQMTLRLAGDTAYIVGTPSAALFVDFDDNGDGTLNKSELRSHRTAILKRFEAGLGLRDEYGIPGEVLFHDVSYSHHHGDKPHVRVTLRVRWDHPLESLAFHYGHSETAPLLLSARRMTAARTLPEQRPVGPIVRIALRGEPQTHILFGGEG